MKMKKYRDLHEEEKEQYEEALQRYQEDHMDEVEIINQHKRCNKTGTKASTKTDTKTGAKAVTKAPKDIYYFS